MTKISILLSIFIFQLFSQASRAEFDIRSSNVEPNSKKPLVIILGQEAVTGLSDKGFSAFTYFSKKPVTLLAIDLPCHGLDIRPGKRNQLNCWADRIAAGENLFAEFNQKLSSAIADLKNNSSIDPQKICIFGASRGTFAGLAFITQQQVIPCLAGLSPMLKMAKLKEFQRDDLKNVLEKYELKLDSEKLKTTRFYFSIASNDDRVSTDEVFKFVNFLRQAHIFNTYLIMFQGEGHQSNLDAESFLYDKISKEVFKL